MTVNSPRAVAALAATHARHMHKGTRARQRVASTHPAVGLRCPVQPTAEKFGVEGGEVGRPLTSIAQAVYVFVMDTISGRRR